MPPISPLLAELAEEFGIATRFWDWKGRPVEVEDATVVGVLAGWGVRADSEESARTALADRRLRSWRRALPACTVARQHSPARVDIHVPAGDPASVWVELEDGRRRSARQVANDAPDRVVDGGWVGEATFEIPDLPLGYHRLRLDTPSGTWDAPLIITPAFVGFPAAVGDRRVWGFAAQLYSIRSTRSWGVGDFADLTDLTIWSATAHGADFVLVNPLHAAEPAVPLEPSPYLPSSRHRINPLYIRPEAIPEYAELDEQGRARIGELRQELTAALAGSDRVQRDPAWTAKLQALRIIHDHGRSPARQMALDRFVRAEGAPLAQFASWCVLVGLHGPDWREWPPELRDPRSPAIAAAVAAHAGEVDFHLWLQWVAGQQLRAAQSGAVDAGMRVGVLNDLAVGVGQGSADSWILGDALAVGVSVGAPPDQYNQLGQDWGQAPWRPDRLEELGYQPFRSILAGILRASGGVRIDHVMGLFRLWWIPQGLSAGQGAYVHYNHEALVGILALEAHRADALVVGEDLGTVEPWVREYLRNLGILGTSVVWFESGPDGAPLPPEQYRDYCMASVTTHDMPPTAGYLECDHIRLQHRLGLLPGELNDEIAQEQGRLDALREILIRRRHLAAGERDPFEQVLALHRYLVASRARVLCVALTDAVGDRRTQNQPGIVEGYPNWCIPLSDAGGKPLTLEHVFDSTLAARLAAVLNERR